MIRLMLFLFFFSLLHFHVYCMCVYDVCMWLMLRLLRRSSTLVQDLSGKPLACPCACSRTSQLAWGNPLPLASLQL